jgi:hypothetical protein
MGKININTGRKIACSIPSYGWKEKAVQGDVILLS